MIPRKWQWVSNFFGPMGWFSDAEKTQHEGTNDFKDGYWRPIPQKEITESNAAIKQLTYEQS